MARVLLGLAQIAATPPAPRGS